MSNVSKSTQLSKLRKAAVRRGVFDKSVRPRKTLGCTVKSEITQQDIDNLPSYGVAQEAFTSNLSAQKANDAIQAIVQNIFGGDFVRSSLHPRSREIYGDEYAPMYDVALDEKNCRKFVRKPKRRYVQNRLKTCKSCAADTGKSCPRLLPSPSGPAQALEILSLRAIQSRPTQRRLKDALLSPRLPPGPSPLAISFTSDDCEDVGADLDEPQNPGDDTVSSTCFILSRKNLSVRREFGIYIVKGEDLAYVGDRGVFSPGYTYFDVAGVYPGPGEQIVSYIQGPISPGWDDGKFEGTATVEEVIMETETALDLKRNSQTILDDSSKNEYASVEHNLPFPTIRPPLPDRSARHVRSQSLGSGIGIGPVVGWRRLRSMGSALTKRRSAQGVTC